MYRCILCVCMCVYVYRMNHLNRNHTNGLLVCVYRLQANVFILRIFKYRLETYTYRHTYETFVSFKNEIKNLLLSG